MRADPLYDNEKLCKRTRLVNVQLLSKCLKALYQHKNDYNH